MTDDARHLGSHMGYAKVSPDAGMTVKGAGLVVDMREWLNCSTMAWEERA